MRRLCYAVAFVLACCTAATAEVRIESSPGGKVVSYLALFEAVRESGQRVVIDGPCLSACTLVLIIVPGSRICVTRRAVLGFHAATVVDQYGGQYPAEAAGATRAVAAAYPAPVRDWIRRHGGLRSRPILLSGRALWAMYPLCR